MTQQQHDDAVSKEELEKFEQFIFEMDDALEAFVKEAEASGVRLAYSIDSLDDLERYVLSKDAESMNSQMRNRAARYLGEVFRKYVGGQWTICLKGRQYLYFKLPVISGYSTKPIEFCPIDIIANLLRQRHRGLLRRAVDSHLEFKA